MTPPLERRIDSIRLENLLSFKCADLQLRNLNVVIGPNGAGKSNLLTALEILRGVRGGFRAALRQAGGIDLRFLGADREGSPCSICVTGTGGMEDDGFPDADARYEIGFDPVTAEIHHESVRLNSQSDFDRYVLLRQDSKLLVVDRFTQQQESVTREEIDGFGSWLNRVPDTKPAIAELNDPERYRPLAHLGQEIDSIRTVRPVSFGPTSAARLIQSVREDETRLLDDNSNLALVLNNLMSGWRYEPIEGLLKRFLPDFLRLTFRVEGGGIRMFLSENGLSKPIPASRFSDGTLAFLRLMALLYEPTAPMILAIEEPEIGLHPDAIRLFADAVKDGSTGKQILITTHSPELVDALSDDPESIVVCEKDSENSTQFRRLSGSDLDTWLERYTLGELWRKGEIGGTRW